MSAEIEADDAACITDEANVNFADAVAGNHSSLV